MAIKIRSAAALTPSGGAATGDWEDAPTVMTRKCVFMDIYGDTGTGRTRLALTAPGPIAFAHAAEKIDGVLHARAKTAQVRVVNFGGVFKGDEKAIATQAAVVWERLKRAWYNSYGWARSSIMDTGSEGWELLRLARLGSLTPKGRTESLYGPVNAEWRSMFKQFRMQEVTNIIAIHQSKDEYIDRMKNNQVSSVKTGRTVRASMKEMGFMADVIVRTYRNSAGAFCAVIEKGWYDATTEGTVFENEDATFADIMSVVTSQSREVWDK